MRPYWPQVWALLSSLGGEPSPGGLAAAWTRHSADYWFLHQWMKLHAERGVGGHCALWRHRSPWPVPPIVVATPILLALPSTRVFGLAAIWLPFAVLRANHKSIGYELPELALYLLAIGMARGPADGDDHEPEDQGPERERVPVADPDVIARTLAPTGVAAHGSVAFAGLVAGP